VFFGHVGYLCDASYETRHAHVAPILDMRIRACLPHAQPACRVGNDGLAQRVPVCGTRADRAHRRHPQAASVAASWRCFGVASEAADASLTQHSIRFGLGAVPERKPVDYSPAGLFPHCTQASDPQQKPRQPRPSAFPDDSSKCAKSFMLH
jgi:hypothetical protein